MANQSANITKVSKGNVRRINEIALNVGGFIAMSGLTILFMVELKSGFEDIGFYLFKHLLPVYERGANAYYMSKMAGADWIYPALTARSAMPTETLGDVLKHAGILRDMYESDEAVLLGFGMAGIPLAVVARLVKHLLGVPIIPCPK